MTIKEIEELKDSELIELYNLIEEYLNYLKKEGETHDN